MSKKNRWKQNPALASGNWHALAPQQGEPSPPVSSTADISEAQLAANRANAQLSTGPRTETGLARSSKNALKSALTGRTVLLPTDDLEEYAAFLADLERDLKPDGVIEREHVQTIVDCHWRLRRIQELEYAIYLRGERQFAESLSDEPHAIRRSIIVLETHLAYQKELRNLHIQEARLDRKRRQALAELKELQRERQQPAEEPAEANRGLAGASTPDSSAELAGRVRAVAEPLNKELFAAMDAGFIPPSIAANMARQASAKENGFDFSNGGNRPEDAAL